MTIPTEPPLTPFQVAQDIVATVQTQGAQAGFSALFNGTAGRLSWVGTSYGSKLLHFAGYRAAPKPAPLIFDDNAHRGLILEPGQADAPEPQRCLSDNYLDYCTWCAQIAAANHTNSAVGEYCLYTIGRTGPTAPATPLGPSA